MSSATEGKQFGASAAERMGSQTEGVQRTAWPVAFGAVGSYSPYKTKFSHGVGLGTFRGQRITDWLL